MLLATLQAGWPGLALLAIPLVVAVQLLFSMSLAFLVASINVRFRDTQNMVGVIVMLAFYITPVFFHPDSFGEHQAIFTFNPMAQILSGYRTILLDGQFPDFTPLAVVALGSALFMVFSLKLFDRQSTNFTEEL
ncbi:ABC-2 type transporter [compost metagenome]